MGLLKGVEHLNLQRICQGLTKLEVAPAIPGSRGIRTCPGQLLGQRLVSHSPCSLRTRGY